MTARILVLLVLIGTLSAPLWAQGNTCRQVDAWRMSGGAGCNYQYPSPDWIQMMEYEQATYGGAGPTCWYNPATAWRRVAEVAAGAPHKRFLLV